MNCQLIGIIFIKIKKGERECQVIYMYIICIYLVLSSFKYNFCKESVMKYNFIIDKV